MNGINSMNCFLIVVYVTGTDIKSKFFITWCSSDSCCKYKAKGTSTKLFEPEKGGRGLEKSIKFWKWGLFCVTSTL